MDQNYFEFFGIQPAFFPDESLIKKKYYEFSKLYHPDFFTGEDQKKQNEVLELSSINNKAYTTLTDYNSRVFYILGLFLDLKTEGNEKMDQDFLFEMMDFNEKLADAQMDKDSGVLSILQKESDQMIKELDQQILPDMSSFDLGNREEILLNRIKDYYFKRKYFLRIRENIANFAGL